MSENRLSGLIPSSLPPGMRHFWVNGNSLHGTLPSSLPNSIADFGANDNFISGAIPPSYSSLINLDTLFLFNNGLSGIIPTLSKMKSLRYLLLGSNKLTGNLPCLPNAILDVKIWYNKLNGSLPIFPNTLKTLDIAGNAFTGTINLTKPETVLIASNYIVSIIIQDKSVLNSCDISNNPLLGYAGLVNLPTCTKTGLYTSTMAHNTTSPSISILI